MTAAAADALDLNKPPLSRVLHRHRQRERAGHEDGDEWEHGPEISAGG